jgi:hypothetical protein
VGEALVEQLKAYRLFRELARRLREREGFTAYGRTAPPPRPEAPGPAWRASPWRISSGWPAGPCARRSKRPRWGRSFPRIA